jgi:hypothetical protein
MSPRWEGKQSTGNRRRIVLHLPLTFP